MLQKLTLLLGIVAYAFTLTAQDLPQEMRISEDGRRLILGGNQTTGFYDDTDLKVIDLEFDQNNYWNLLDEDTPARLIFEGETFEGVGIRFKGATSDFMNDSQKKSFNVSLDFTDDGADIEGYQTLNFNGGFQDASHLREILYNWIGRHYNPSLKTSFIHLKINGESWGAYSNVQQLNKDYLEEWFLNNNGSRFRCIDPDWEPGPGGGGGGPPTQGPCNGGMGGGPGGGGGNGWGGGPSSLNWLGTDSTEYQENYTLKGTDREDPWGELITSIDKLNNLPLEQLPDSLSGYFDIDKTLWYLAHEILFTDDDSYVFKGRMDYYVYFDDALEVLIPLEYDGNTAMKPDLVDWSPTQREDDECFPLIYRLMMVSEFRQRYLAHCRTIIENYMDIDLIHDKIDFYAGMIDSYEANDPIGDELFSYQQYLNGVQELKNFFEDRRDFLLANDEIDRTGLTISEVAYSVNGTAFEQPNESDEVVVNATISSGDSEAVYLYYGEGFMGKFEKTEMFDDGQHGDGAANDGVFGASIPAYNAGEYVRYYIEAVKADNFDTRTYEPVGAEHDVFIYQVLPGVQVNSDVVINEFMASNDAIQSDQDEEFDDWIELYNISGSAIDLGAYFLSDDATNLSKWEFPAGTVIEGNDYLIIWADEDEEQEGLHANFKLSKDGEAVYLVTPEGEIADQIVYGAQETDLAYARQPNGTGDFIIKTATFNANNDNAVATEDLSLEASTLSVFPNPATRTVTVDFYTGGVEENHELRIYNTLGIQILQTVINGATRLDVTDLTPGVYLLTVENKTVRLVIN